MFLTSAYALYPTVYRQFHIKCFTWINLSAKQASFQKGVEINSLQTLGVLPVNEAYSPMNLRVRNRTMRAAEIGPKQMVINMSVMYKVRSALSVHGTPVPQRDTYLSPGRILTWFPHSLAAQHGQFDVIHVRVQPSVSMTAN